MSTTEVKNESVKKEEYPSRKSHQEAEAKTKVLFSTEKLCFQPGVPELSTIQELLQRSDDPYPEAAELSICRIVRVPGALTAHCVKCMRAGFIGGVPA
jgi:hypothetical protein